MPQRHCNQVRAGRAASLWKVIRVSLLPYGDLDSLPEDLRKSLSGRLPANLYRAMMQSPAALRAFLAFATQMAQHELGKPLREVIILRIAALRGAAYVMHQHRHLARAMGLSDDKIEAIEHGHLQSGTLSDLERALLRFVDELASQHRGTRATIEILKVHLTLRQIVDATMIAGQYFMVAAFLETFEVEIEGDGEIPLDRYIERAAWQPPLDAA
jgi:4-carboxymuconolactone decarboxylase